MFMIGQRNETRGRGMDKVEEIINNFDFDNVKIYLDKQPVFWGFKSTPPTIDKIKSLASRLLTDSAHTNGLHRCGGFQADYNITKKNEFTLTFEGFKHDQRRKRLL